MDEYNFLRLMDMLNEGKPLFASLKTLGFNQRIMNNIPEEYRTSIYEVVKRKKFSNSNTRVTTVLCGKVKECFYKDLVKMDIKETELLNKITRKYYNL